MLIFRNPPNERRPGFTLVEALVVFGIMAIVMAVIAPIGMTRIRQSQLSALKSTLEALQNGIIRYKTDVTKNPARLQLLSNSPVGQKDACDVGLSLTNANKWRGPYVSLNHIADPPRPDTVGVTSNDWYLRDLMVRTPASIPVGQSVSSTGRLAIEITGMRTADATYLNTLIDGLIVPPLNGVADTAGSLRWTGVASGFTVSTTFGFVIYGC